jgi:hypothetical protein
VLSTLGYTRIAGEEKEKYTKLMVSTRVIKSRRMRWAGHAARMGEKRNA